MMRIGAATSLGDRVRVDGAERTARDVEPQRTPVTRSDLRGAIERAHQKLTGHAASPALVDMLTAHASLETGSGAHMYNYNFGGIKGRSPESGQTAVCRTKEVLDERPGRAGKEVEVRAGFRAYRSLDEGAVDYVRLMRDRFGGAVSRAEHGDVDGFAHALKQAHYYTADEAKYASTLRTLSGVAEPSTTPRRTAALTNTNMSFDAPGSSGATYPDSVELGRVLDAIARHPIQEEEEDDLG